ncbi:MAG: class I SAM-dependent methyltransferase [Planctomycetes bacterium]|nr:class I SAM-dependent methyltransferase [Planctomycetota bacterium]
MYWSDAAHYGQLFPRPSRSEVASYYDIEYYTHADESQPRVPRKAGFFGRPREHLAWRRDVGTDLTAAALSKWLPVSGQGSVLEIGCGDGKLLSEMIASGWVGVGVEPDSQARKVAIARGLEIHNGTAEDPPPALTTGQFDSVVMQHVLEHCLDPLQAIRTAASFTKLNGIVIVETPNNTATSCRISGATWPWLDVPRHLNFFTPKSLSAMCQMADLEIISIEYTGYIRQFQTTWIEMQQSIIDAFSNRPELSASLWSYRHHSQWNLLIQTMFSRPELKYDSVRIVARRTTASESST